ncbi:SAM-dependent methyltransferase [Thermomonospora cellulosilytica]|uniref:SAM-dependent MidA family methyltransferase n=1 Tax=Thermomonospora cellulosilytica TaxID=1411118 RepID=A0A7W3MT99_9ACTN|nr:SAM-dependent methyltransferase [Thermomonospora cellulosilytica]MBA9001497.1 SAM-dependent MidA family methyltransferase [Thermomonospora cellulosilytica]
MDGWVRWRTAMRQALYGEGGFYRRGERPAAHFRTSVHASPHFADAVAQLLAHVDAALERPSRIDLVDIGAGSGELVVRILQTADPDLAERLNPVAVELAPRPSSLPGRITWRPTLPDAVTGLVIANEWLDNVPLDVVELTPEGPRLVLVDPATGAERPGPAPADEDLAWLERWWPLENPGDRAEIGHPRCTAWSGVLSRLHAGLAVAIDYSHTREARPVHGTLTGYRDGHTVLPVPDGSCDITAHVALDACATAGAEAGATATVLTTQRRVLRALGLTGARPPIHLAHRDPRAYVHALRRAGEEAELIDPAGLGGFGWLAQAKHIPLPKPLQD